MPYRYLVLGIWHLHFALLESLTTTVECERHARGPGPPVEIGCIQQCEPLAGNLGYAGCTRAV